MTRPKAQTSRLVTHAMYEILGFLYRRAQQDRILESASSLTLSTVMALVPLLAVVLSLFTSFPLFQEFSDALQTFLIQNLLPDDISETIMQHLNEFATQASRLTAIGSSFLILTSVLLVMSVDSVLNQIWHVNRARSFTQRVIVYWGVISLGPIIVGASLWLSAYIAQKSIGLFGEIPNLFGMSLSLLPFALTCVGFTLLFMIVPHRHVSLSNAIIGGVITTVILEAVKLGLAYYIKQFPTYKIIYGAFSTLPVFLIWLYTSWLGVLIGATVAANLPVILSKKYQSQTVTGSVFIDSLQILDALQHCQQQQPAGATIRSLLRTTRVDSERLDEILQLLETLNYVTHQQQASGERWFLVCDPKVTPIGPVFDRLVIDRRRNDLDKSPQLRTALAQMLAGANEPTLADVQLRHDNQSDDPLQSGYSSMVEENQHAKSQ